MHKFRQNLRSYRKAITFLAQRVDQHASHFMVFVTSHFHGDKKARVQTVLHIRPSNISSYHSSRVPSGCSTWPKSNGGKSRALWPPLRVFRRRICRMIISNSASSSEENCAAMISISWSVLIRLNIGEMTAPGKPATVSIKPWMSLRSAALTERSCNRPTT
jgi:hypothetical protein